MAGDENKKGQAAGALAKMEHFMGTDPTGNQHGPAAQLAYGAKSVADSTEPSPVHRSYAQRSVIPADRYDAGPPHCQIDPDNQSVAVAWAKSIGTRCLGTPGARLRRGTTTAIAEEAGSP